MTNINLSGAVVHSDDKKIVVLVDSNKLTEKEADLLESETGFLFSYNYDQDCIKTKDQYIQTAKVDGGSLDALTEGQWLIGFEIQ